MASEIIQLTSIFRLPLLFNKSAHTLSLSLSLSLSQTFTPFFSHLFLGPSTATRSLTKTRRRRRPTITVTKNHLSLNLNTLRQTPSLSFGKINSQWEFVPQSHQNQTHMLQETQMILHKPQNRNQLLSQPPPPLTTTEKMTRLPESSRLSSLSTAPALPITSKSLRRPAKAPVPHPGGFSGGRSRRRRRRST